MKTNTYEVGQRIKNIRKSKGLTLEQFGSVIDNSSKGNVSKWEHGVSVPNNKRLKLIADLGKLYVEELLYDKTRVVTVKKSEDGIPVVIELGGLTYIYQTQDQDKKEDFK